MPGGIQPNLSLKILLVGTDKGPVLNDTSLGLHDYAEPAPKVR